MPTHASAKTSRPGAARRTIRVLIVDDHPIVREGLVSLLSRQPDFEICGEAADMRSALHLVDQTRPHVVTIDISLKDGTGLDLIRRIAERDRSIRMVVCSLYDETLYAERALHAGAMGYVNKQEATRTIVKAVRQVLEGKTYLSDRMSDILAQRLIGKRDKVQQPIVDLLSDRELEVFEMIGSGLTSAEIAGKLHIGVKTVETHRRRIKAKLRVKTAAQLARDAAHWVLQNG
ncbi:MAG: response regulator transcription factor [Deltaproteobacteria bacterium]